MIACKEGHDKIVELLLQKGADIDIQETTGWTALMIATCGGIDNGLSDEIKTLLVHGAHVFSKTPSSIFSRSIVGHPLVVKALLKAKADITISESVTGQTAFILACSWGNVAVVETFRAK